MNKDMRAAVIAQIGGIADAEVCGPAVRFADRDIDFLGQRILEAGKFRARKYRLSRWRHASRVCSKIVMSGSATDWLSSGIVTASLT